MTLPTCKSLLSGAVLAFCAAAPLGCSVSHAHDEGHHEHQQKVVLTAPKVADVVVTQQYVCQIHSQRHIKVCALQSGYLEKLLIREGQAVKQGDPLFTIVPTLYKARLDAELAEAQLAQLEYNNTQKLLEKKVVSENEVALSGAKLAKAQAKAKLAAAELEFTIVRAPFDGIIDHLHEQQGSLVKEGDKLTTLSDNGLMWVYFNVPETRYLEYKTRQGPTPITPQRLELADSRIELVLANGRPFPHGGGGTVTVEGEFNRETGNIPFRADVPNPEGLLRHGQTGNVLIHQTVRNALVIPQRATFEILDKVYVFVVGPDRVVRQREVTVLHELADVFVLKKGLAANERIVLDGVQLVRDGQTVEDPEFRTPDDVLKNQKFHAE